MIIKKLLKKRKREGGRLASNQKINKNCRLKKVWIWPEKVERKIKNYIRGYTLNVCAGRSKLGDIKIDLDPIGPGVERGDMNNLPYPDNTFDTVISDPPWKINFFKRMKPFFEAVRVCKIGGRIIYNCVWRPTSKFVELEKAIVRSDGNFTNVSIIWIFRKRA